MNDIEQILLNILKERFNGLSMEYADSDLDLQSLSSEAEAQAVKALIFPWVNKNIQEESLILQSWRRIFLTQVADWYYMIDIQNELVQLLSSHNYQFVIMKGAANACFYPEPELRVVGDIDFLVHEEQYKEICEFLIDNGYRSIEEIDGKMHHIGLEKAGIVFELHKRPAGSQRYSDDDNSYLKKFFEDGISQPEIMKVYDYSFPVLPVKQNGIMLLLHIAIHLKVGIGIRHLLDWMVYAKKHLNDGYWEREFKEVAEKAHVTKLAMILTRTCQIYLGLTEDMSWCKPIDDQICHNLIDYFFEQGNFGRKLGKEDADIEFFSQSRTISGFLKQMDLSSQYSFPIVKRYVFLRPFGWACQMGRYLVKALTSKKSIEDLLKDQRKGIKRAEFFEQLGIEFKKTG